MRKKGRRLLAASMAALRLFCFCLAPVVLLGAAGRVPCPKARAHGEGQLARTMAGNMGLAALGHMGRAAAGLRGAGGRAAGLGDL